MARTVRRAKPKLPRVPVPKPTKVHKVQWRKVKTGLVEPNLIKALEGIMKEYQ